MATPPKRDQRLTPDALTEQVLTQSQSSREVIQEFVPLADSLEWNLGQHYLKDRGNKAFISDASPVPFVINNDGTLSRHAAEVFVASLMEADKARDPHPQPLSQGERGESDPHAQPTSQKERGDTDPHPQPLSQGERGDREPHAQSVCQGERGDRGEIHVLELGIGVGLFARYFLDHVQELSRKHRKDYYHRLIYTAADRSERMLTDVLRHGILARHPGRYRARQIDAMQPEVLGRDVTYQSPHPQPLSQGERGEGKPFRAVFLNYLLDCLPAAVLRFEGDEVQQLHVRTCVARNVKLGDYTDLNAEQLRKRAKSGDAQAKQDLLEVYGLFASEYDYRPVDIKKLPYGDFAPEYARRTSNRLLHSHGAIRCLERLLDLVADDGFILVNDYGPTQTTRDDDFEHQRFSLATFVGVNFPQVEAYFSETHSPSPPTPLPEGEGWNWAGPLLDCTF
jgi:hypothetical protein